MAQDSCARLVGRVVNLTEKNGLWKPCRFCGCTTGEILTSKGPTAVSLSCTQCGGYLGLLSQAHVSAFLAILGQEGAA